MRLFKRTIITLSVMSVVFAVLIGSPLFKPVDVCAAKKTFTVTPDSKPYKNQYVKSGRYNKYTKHYYMLRSYS